MFKVFNSFSLLFTKACIHGLWLLELLGRTVFPSLQLILRSMILFKVNAENIRS